MGMSTKPQLTHVKLQMLIVCLAGVGASVTAGSAVALTLVSTTFCVQLLVFLWITCLCPSIDRVDNVAVALGWGVESCSMLLLMLGSFLPSLRTDSFQTAAFALSLLGVGVPLLKLSYDAILVPLGSYFFQYIDGEARTNPCSTGTLLQLVRLLGTAGRQLAATCYACSTCCFARSSGGATAGMASGPVADSGVVYGGRDDGRPARRQKPSATGPPEAPPRRELRSKSSSFGRPSSRLTAPSAAPGTTAGSGQAAGADTAPSPDSARGTRRRLTERSPRGPTGPEPPPVRV